MLREPKGYHTLECCRIKMKQIVFQLLFSPLLPPRFLGPADGCECEALAMDAEARRRCCRSPLGSGASLSLSGERGEDHIFILETEKCSRGRRS